MPEKTEIKRDMMKRIPLPERDAAIRRTDFSEVALNYSKEEMLLEAERCLHCPTAPCSKGCPVGIDIPGFIGKLAADDAKGAYEIIRSANALPAVTSRVCPQECQCEGKCVRGKKGEALAIGRLERYAADHGAPAEVAPLTAPADAPKVAVIGSGPAGLTCAAELAEKGCAVTVFEALHRAGGVLAYGIPSFRLPKEVTEKEIAAVEARGVDIQTNVVIGRSITVAELLEEEGYQAVFLGSGAGLPRFAGIPGENLPQVCSANEFLTRVNLMHARSGGETPLYLGKKVAVVGAGNVAMDAARCAVRLGAEEVMVVYRRGAEEVPARAEEVHHAKQEGVVFHLQSAPQEILADENGAVAGIKCLHTEPAESDGGRRAYVPVEGSEFVIDCDMVIVAIGTTPNPLIPATTPGLETNRGCIVTGGEAGDTSLPGVFAGGDAVSGAATVILAMGAGKNAANAIWEYLQNK